MTAPVILDNLARPARLMAFYEGAQWSPLRSYNYTVLQESDKDLDKFTLDELAKNSRNLYKNSPFIHGMFERIVTYVVGNGIFPFPGSSDPAWNDRALAVLKFIFKYPQAVKRATWGKTVRKILRETLIDGNLFVQKTVGPSGRRRINLIRYERLAKDGIKRDKFGRVTGYVFKGLDGKEMPVIPAEFIVHFSNDLFSDSTLGEPLLASAMTTATDIADIIKWEKAAVKEMATKKDVIKRAGAGPIDTASIMQTGGIPLKVDQSSNAYYVQKLGPESVILDPGDSYEMLTSNRPSPAWQGFMDFLSNTVCMAANLPPSIILQIKVGGADTRRDGSAAQRGFEIWQDDLVSGLQDIIEYFIEGEIQDGSLINPPKDWREMIWQTPRSFSVDAGREAAQDREDVLVGLSTEMEYQGRWGVHWLEPRRQREVETRDLIQRAQAIAADMKVPFEIALELMSKRNVAKPAPQSDQSQPQGTTP